MKKLILSGALIASALLAEPYTAFNGDEVLGKGLNLAKLYEYTDTLCVRACTTLDFDSEADAEQAYKDSSLMASIYGYIEKEVITDKIDARDRTIFDLQFAKIYTSQHNFGVVGAMEKADKIYDRALAREPQNGDLMSDYGEFLLKTKRVDKAKETLQKAISLGSPRPNLALATIALMDNNNIGAIELLERYCSAYPDNEQAKKLLDGLKSGDITIEKTAK